jgi:hypothetical protein
MSAAPKIELGPTALTLVTLSNFGRLFTTGEIELSREERTASGRLVRDVIAVKRRWVLSYSLIDEDEMEVLIGMYTRQAPLVLRRWFNEMSTADYNVLMRPSDRTRLLHSPDNGSLWENVSFEFEEI